MYANPLHHEPEVVLDVDNEADDKTVAWLKRDLERRREERAAAQKLVSIKKKKKLVSSN